MKELLNLTGTLTGYLGALICLVTGLARITGYFYIAGYQSTTLFNVGIGLMVFACLIKLDGLKSPRRE